MYFLRFAQIGLSAELGHQAARDVIALRTHDEPVAGVVCPESAGYLLGRRVANRLDVPLAVVGIDAGRRPNGVVVQGAIGPGAHLVINDVSSTGSALRALEGCVLASGGTVSESLVFGAHQSAASDAGPGRLVDLIWPTYPPGGCPGCQRRIPLIPYSEIN